MYRMPSAKRKKNIPTRLNLVPVLDAIFIFIFFLLLSANFHKIFEISSDIPIVSDSPPPKDEKIPLSLTLKIDEKGFTLLKGVPSKIHSMIPKLNAQDYDLEKLHQQVIEIKKMNMEEDAIVIEPVINIEYGKIIEIMDSVRILRNTDEALFKENKKGHSEKLKTIFPKIVFGNLLS